MARKPETIFVQIASYRDPDLLNTLTDILSKAKSPQNLRFGISWQHSEDDEWDNLDEYQDDDRFRILDIPSSESQGLVGLEIYYNNYIVVKHIHYK